MATLPLSASGSSYWQWSRAPRYSVAFALPLLALYETLAAALNRGEGGVRNGADVLLKSFFAAFVGPRGPVIFGVLLVLTMIALVFRDLRRHPGPLRPRIFLGMLLESVALALVFGIVVGLITAQLVSSLRHLALGPMDRVPWATALMVSLGAGLYEELLFRVVLVSLVLWLGRHVLGLGQVAASVLAVMTGAVIFAAFHYVGPYGDRLEIGSFVFRTVAGLAFSGLYVTRGFGITAWTHALYDVFLLIARS
jgi:membrane protease YdiL (CAAX protease family)